MMTNTHEVITLGDIVAAEGEAQAIKLVNEAADMYFVGNAQLLRKLETVERSVVSNAKIVLPSGAELVNVIGELSGVLPLARKTDKDLVGYGGSHSEQQ